MTQVCIARAIGLSLWIDMKHYSCDLPPVGPLAFGLQKSRVRHDMLLVINRQSSVTGRSVRDVWIEWRLRHKTPYLSLDNF